MTPKSTFAASITKAAFTYYESGDEQLLTPLLDELRSSLNHYAEQQLGVYDNTRRADLVQEALLYILRSLRLRQFRGTVGEHGERVGLLAWAKQVCRYRYLEGLRQRIPSTPGRDENPFQTLASLSEESPAETLSYLPQAEAVLTAATEAVLALPPKLREVVVQIFFRGLSQPQAAERLGLRLSTLRDRLQAALVELRQWAAQQPVQPTGDTYRVLHYLDTGDLFQEAHAMPVPLRLAR